MKGIFFYCSLCLHLFNLGFQDQSIALQRDNTCNTCLKDWLNSPELNAHHGIESTDGKDFSFDYRLLPIFHKAIEEKIQYAYERTEAQDSESMLLTSLPFHIQYCFNNIYPKLFNFLREVYSYEREVKRVNEEEKQIILDKIAQRIEDTTLVSQKLSDIAQITRRTEMGIDFDFEKDGESMKKMANMMRRRQIQAKNSAESLLVNETINNIKDYSKLAYDYYIQYEECRNDDERGFSMFARLKTGKEPFEIEVEEVDKRKIQSNSQGFENILLKFDFTVEEFAKEIDQYFCATRWKMLEKRVEERLEALYSEPKEVGFNFNYDPVTGIF